MLRGERSGVGVRPSLHVLVVMLLSKASVSLRTSCRSSCKAAIRDLSSLSSFRNSSVVSRVQVEKKSQLKIPAAMASHNAPVSVLSG